MKKYNRSEIMKKAWELYKMAQKWSAEYKLSFGECLRRSWADAKKVASTMELIKKQPGLIRMEIGMANVIVNLGDCIVSGNTYKCKDVLKRYGLFFNGYEKHWEGSREEIIALVKDYAA